MRRADAGDTTLSDTLADVPPKGFLTEEGWRHTRPESRASAMLREAQERIEGAAHALQAMTLFMEAGRAKSINFISKTLLDEARLMRRALKVQSEAAEIAETRGRRRRP